MRLDVREPRGQLDRREPMGRLDLQREALVLKVLPVPMEELDQVDPRALPGKWDLLDLLGLLVLVGR